MDKGIFKYETYLTDRFELDMPVGAEILTVQVQNGRPFLWALVSPDSPKVQRSFRLIGTGHPVEDTISKESYIGTYQVGGGRYVFHLFEEKR